MEIDLFIDDDSTLVPDNITEQTLGFEADIEPPAPCHFLTLPLEVRKRIYRLFCLSDVGFKSHPRRWRPSGQDGSCRGIGYFERDTVLPLLLTCWQVRNEAATVLYGENVFAFHISVLGQGPILFFSWLAPGYVRLLRKVYIRTGFDVDTYDFDPYDGATRRHVGQHPSEMMEWKAAKNLTISATLIKEAWPGHYHVQVNKEAVLPCSRQDDWGMWTQYENNNWPKASFHLWKMVPTKDNIQGFRPEFRRVKWVGGDNS